MIEATLGGILWKLLLLVEERSETALCRSLVAENHDVILNRKRRIRFLTILTKRFDIIGILGNGANFKILEQADVEDCDIFISIDRVRWSEHGQSAVLAKKMGAKETIVRVRNPEYSILLQGKKYLGLLPGCQSGIAVSSLYCQYHWLPKCPFCRAFCQWPSCLDGI